MEHVDVAIIGAGVLGAALARELSRYRLDVMVLERAHDVGEGSSKANSGIVHAGFQPRAGSLKGRSCVEGNRMMRALAEELDIPFRECGALMVAFDGAGIEKLEEKAARALGNGAGKLPIVSGQEARRLEPRLSERVVAALLAPSTAVISPFDLVLALAQNAEANGVLFRFRSEVERIERSDARYVLHMRDGSSVSASYVANMAGDSAVTLDMQVHPAEYEVRPRIGEYLVFDKQDPEQAISHVIYQAAETDEGGTLLAPTVDGNLLAGPTSQNARSFTEGATTAGGLAHVRRVARKLIPDLDMGEVIHSFAGARANIVNVPKELKDFVVRVSAPRFVSALGIKNPGLTSSPYLAKCAAELLRQEGLELAKKRSFAPRRKAYVPFLRCGGDAQARLLREDPAFGHIVCRCENITAGDVKRVLSGPLAPTTMAGVKRRLRCGMGRCQGSFCEPRVADLMAAHSGVEPREVPYGEYGGRFVIKSVK